MNDKDVKDSLDDCLALKKLFLEVDLLMGGQAASAPAAKVQETNVNPAVHKVETRAVQQPESADAKAEQLLSKYGLSSPREKSTAASASSSSGTPHPAPQRVVHVTPVSGVLFSPIPFFV